METIVNYSPTMRVCAISPEDDVYAIERWNDNRKEWHPSQLINFREAQLLVPLFEG